MKKREITKQSKHRLMLFGTISCIIILYTLFSIISYGIKVNNLKKSESALNSKLVSLQTDGTHLKNEIKKLKDPDYLARYARENFLYSKEDEYIIKIGNKEVINDEEKIENINYELIFSISSMFAIFVIGYIVRKTRK